VLGWAIVLAVPTSLTKLATGWWAARRQGIGLLGRAREGAALIARGEFSIVIAGLAVSYAAVPAELSALATAFVEPVAKALQVRRTAAQPSPTAGQ
jgi:CPA2 family monovalent cation:H+ antiporter-2